MLVGWNTGYNLTEAADCLRGCAARQRVGGSQGQPQHVPRTALHLVFAQQALPFK